MVHGTIGWEEQLLGSAIMCQMMPVMGVPPLARDIAQFSWGVGFTLEHYIMDVGVSATLSDPGYWAAAAKHGAISWAVGRMCHTVF